jgi:hypothetical protein
VSADVQAVREDLRALARMYGVGGDCKALCLAVIDRAATCATTLHGEIPADVLGHLTRAMHAAGREDGAGVIEEVEGALALLDNPKAKPRKASRAPEPPPLPGREGRARAKPVSTPVSARTAKAQAIGETIDPLLARLRGKSPRKV